MISVLLLAAWINGGGVGTLMQPNAGKGGSPPPPVGSSITTLSGVSITTLGGTKIVTE